MSQGWRSIWVGLFCAQVMALAGCGATESALLPGDSLATDLALEEMPRLARSQRPDSLPPGGARAPAPAAAKLPSLPVAGSPTPSGAKQTNLIVPRMSRINVRAWVNGKPIFDEEVMQNIPPQIMRQLSTLPDAQRSEKLAEVFNQTLDQIVEQEVVYQEAVQKLEKGNPLTLGKLKTMAQQEFDKQVDKIRKSSQVPEEEIKEFQKQMRRQSERSFISMEYMRSRIFPLINQGIGFQEIKDYYDTHPNEFQKVENVKWQDVFLAVGPKYPTLAHARRYAEDLIAQCRTGADFVKMVQYDDGDSKFRGGEGLGSRRGEIRPVELEEHLFKLKDGEIGPVVDMTTGVHIFRVIKRETGGQMLLDETVQAQIRNKLRSQLADREYKRIVRDLKARSVIEVVGG